MKLCLSCGQDVTHVAEKELIELSLSQNRRFFRSICLSKVDHFTLNKSDMFHLSLLLKKLDELLGPIKENHD